jgi:hypothetical protein
MLPRRGLLFNTLIQRDKLHAHEMTPRLISGIAGRPQGKVSATFAQNRDANCGQ